MSAKIKTTKGKRQGKKTALEVAGVPISHPDKEVYPDIHLSKGELAEYYSKIAPLLLVESAHRPLSLVRCPNGAKACFFQKHLGEMKGTPIPTVSVLEDSGAQALYPYLEDQRDVVELVQLNVIEFHQWGSSIEDVERPNRLVIDLDPGDDVPEKQIIKGALLLQDLFKHLKLTSYPKSTGGKGLHVVLPITGTQGWDFIKSFAKHVASALAAEDPQQYVAVSTKSKRTGKVYVDYLRNGRGATSVASYSARARAGAPVAVPLEWAELKNQSTLPRFSVKDVKELLSAKRRKVWDGIAKVRQILPEGF